MIGGGAELVEEGDAGSGFDRRGEQDLAEELGVDRAAAREGEEQAARVQAREGEAVQILVGAGGGLDVRALADERRGIADDEVVALGALAEVLEDVGLHPEAAGFVESVRGVESPPALDQLGRGLDVDDPARAAAERVEPEAARVGEEVEHAASRGIALDQAPVLPLIAIEAGLLAARQIGAKEQAALAELDLVRHARSDRLVLWREALGLARGQAVDLEDRR